MKNFALGLLVAASTVSSFVIPDNFDIALEKVHAGGDKVRNFAEHELENLIEAIELEVSEAVDYVTEKVQFVSTEAQSVSDEMNDWFQAAVTSVNEHEDLDLNIPGGRKFDFSSCSDSEHELEKEPKHKKPKKGKHDSPHDQRDKTIYEFIASNEHFTTLYDLIKDDEKIVKGLNKTGANITFFAPTNKALEKLHHTPSKEVLEKVLLYHTVPKVVPAGQVLKTKTLESLYYEEEIKSHQRISVDIGLPRGLTLNYYARIVYVDVFTSNGVLHAIDAPLLPPPSIYDIAELLPQSFSTFINAAWKTGTVNVINETEHSTILAPSNFGFSKLGPRINAYLFSKRGQPTLVKLLKYHIVPDVLFYTDFLVKYTGKVETDGLVVHNEFKTLGGDVIYVDVGTYGRFTRVVVNGRPINMNDIPAKNGVLQKLDSVILPYKSNGMSIEQVAEMSIEEFEALFD